MYPFSPQKFSEPLILLGLKGLAVRAKQAGGITRHVSDLSISQVRVRLLQPCPY